MTPGGPGTPEHNPFLDYLDSHSGADITALKQLFRMLAKRTHPDLGAENEADFIALQDAYNEAVAVLLARTDTGAGTADGRDSAGRPGTRGGRPGGRPDDIWFPATPRERVLHFLYRYRAHLPTESLDSPQLPPACMRAFSNALEASSSHTDECRHALAGFHDQFHLNRAELIRFPEVTTKYRPLIRGLASFFDFCLIPNVINRRLISSYLREIKPVMDFNPEAGPLVRTNRSAAARSAMYRMRTWLESEVETGPCRVL